MQQPPRASAGRTKEGLMGLRDAKLTRDPHALQQDRVKQARGMLVGKRNSPASPTHLRRPAPERGAVSSPEWKLFRRNRIHRCEPMGATSLEGPDRTGRPRRWPSLIEIRVKRGPRMTTGTTSDCRPGPLVKAEAGLKAGVQTKPILTAGSISGFVNVVMTAARPATGGNATEFPPRHCQKVLLTVTLTAPPMS